VMNGCDYLRNAIVIAKRIGRNLFVFIVIAKKNLKMKINEYKKKGCDKEGNPFKRSCTHH
jgi:hypothetical protein